jgi:hypothetical protein
MLKLVVLLTALFFSPLTHAGYFTDPGGEYFLRYGVISGEGTLTAFPNTKLFLVGLRRDHKIFTTQLEFGGFFDGRAGAKNAAIAILSAGLKTQTLPFSFYYLPGVALMSSTDAFLSTIFQFSHDLGISLKDARGVSLDFSYRHISNAGIALPNAGRNFLVLKLGLPSEIFFSDAPTP